MAEQWVTDTSVYTHLSRAGYLHVLEKLCPGNVLLVPSAVDEEIRDGQDRYQGILTPGSRTWVRIVTLTDEEEFTQLVVKAALGGGPDEHLGECAAIACAKHRGLVLLLDERRAITQADLHGVVSRDTLWLAIEAYATLFDFDRRPAVDMVDALLATDMRLPFESGDSLFAWAYEEGLLPRPAP